MGVVKRLLALALANTAMPGHAQRPDPIGQWQPYIAEAAARFGLPTEWIAHVMRIESGGLTSLDRRPIRSPAGAIGLMQLMPSTWADLRQRYALGRDPDDPHDNILAGAAYLRRMYDSFGYPGVFAAYNAGPGRYEEHLRTGLPLPSETRTYIALVTGDPARPVPRAAVGRDLFLLRVNRPSSSIRGYASSPLFAVTSRTPATDDVLDASP